MSEERPQGEFPKAEYVPQALAEEGHEHLNLGVGRAIGSALLAGAFVTFGALLSILIPAGVETEGLTLLLQGLTFAVGYYFVALAGVALFTGANITARCALRAQQAARTPRPVLGPDVRFQLRRRIRRRMDDLCRAELPAGSDEASGRGHRHRDDVHGAGRRRWLVRESRSGQ